MIKSNFSKQRNIPNITTRKSSPMTTNFAKGIYTYKPNDTMGLDELRLAQDARFDRVGEYGTRKGYSRLTTAIGEADLNNNYSASYVGIKASEATPYTFSASASGPLYRIRIRAKKLNDNYVAPKVILSSGDNILAEGVVRPGELTTNLSEKDIYFQNVPTVTSGQSLTITIGVQTGSLDDFQVATPTSGGTVLMCNTYTCTAGSVKNVFEANINGDRSILFVFDGKLYWRNSSGTVASIRTLPAGVDKVRFVQVNNQVRYADGKEEPHLLAPTVNGSGVVTAWADSRIDTVDLETDVDLDIKVSNISQGFNDNLLYFDADTTTQMVWTWPYGYEYAKSPAFSTTATISGSPGTTLTIQKGTITPSGIAVGDWITGQGEATAEVTSISGNNVYCKIVSTAPVVIGTYDKFNQNFRQNFPAINTGDPLTAMFNLGGVTYVLTRRNKYQMYSQTAEAWTQSPSNAQNGTFSQESVVCDLNYAYFANESGVYIFDGSSEASLTENTIQNVYDNIPDKEKIVLDMYKNRLYIYYPSQAGGPNDSCLVYNINLRVWESFDSNTFVSATSARQNSSSHFICGHSQVGMLMLNEDGNYSDMSSPIAFNLETAYQHFGATSQLKRITKWRPEMATSEKPYTCECGYALDFTDQVQYAFSIDLQRQEVVTADYVWDNPSDYGVPAIPTIHTTIPQVNGEFYRCQIRYQHIAAFEPVIFRSHTLTVQTQRIR